MKNAFAGLSLVVVLGACQPTESPQTQTSPKFTYPDTKTVEQVDDYHGTQVKDPYRWLEEDVRNSEEVARWVDAQNAVTQAHLQTLPEREAIVAKLTELWNYERFSTPREYAGKLFYTKNDGLQNQSVLYVQQEDRKSVV